MLQIINEIPHKLSSSAIECAAIIAVLSIVGFAFLRRGNRDYLLAVLPLLILPAIHLIGAPISFYIHRDFGINFYTSRIFIDILAIVTACTLFGLVGMGFNTKKTKLLYMLSSAGFTIILGWSLILDLLRLIK